MGLAIADCVEGPYSFQKGVMSRGWNESGLPFVVTFSAQSSGGVSIWGSRPALSVEDP